MRRKLIEWIVEDVGIPLLPLIASAFVKFVFKGVDLLGLFKGPRSILWSAELPFFTAVLGATTAFQLHSIATRLRAANAIKGRKTTSDVVKAQLAEADRLHTKLYGTWAVLGLVTLVDVLSLGGFYYAQDPEAAFQVVFAAGAFLVGLWIRPHARAAEKFLDDDDG